MSSNQVCGDWWFDEIRAGAVGTNSLREVLQGARLEGAELFVREVTQNAVDAFADLTGAPVRVFFRSELLSSEASDAVRQFLFRSGEAGQHWAEIQDSEPNDLIKNALGGLRDGPNRVRALIVEDFGTIGLGGQIGGRGPADHFSRLIYFFGETHGDGSMGGAYGFGKSVLSVASRVRTVIYYSRPRPSNDDPNPASRLIGVSLLPSHTLDGIEYTGYALCGVASDDDPRFPIHPVSGSAADGWACRLGFTPRGDNEYGTSIMVVDCHYDIADIRSALEKWWWPRILSRESGRLEAILVSDGKRLPPPDPRNNPMVQPFVRPYERLLDGTEDDDDISITKLRGLGKRPLGRLALQTMPSGREEQPKDPSEEGDYCDRRVALFRSPRLVVEYLREGSESLQSFVGVFAADPGIDPILRRSEPPAHDHWAHESSRLNRDQREDTIVQGVARQIRKHVREFQQKQEPTPRDEPSHLRELESILGRVFKRGRAPGPVPPGPARRVHLSVHSHRDFRRGEDVAHIEVQPVREQDSLSGQLVVGAELVGDARLSRLEDLPIRLFTEDGSLAEEGQKIEHSFILNSGCRVRFEARVRSVVDGRTRFRVSVKGGDL